MHLIVLGGLAFIVIFGIISFILNPREFIEMTKDLIALCQGRGRLS